MNVFDVEHLTLAEMKEIATEVWNHWQAVLTGDLSQDEMLIADVDELTEEYAFWMAQIEGRLEYDNSTEIKS